MNKTISWYDSHAKELAVQYESLNPESLNGWLTDPSGTQLTWLESWRHSGFITTRLACTARLTAPRQDNALERPPPLWLNLMATPGSNTVVGCFRPQLSPDYEFATHTFFLSYLR